MRSRIRFFISEDEMMPWEASWYSSHRPDRAFTNLIIFFFGRVFWLLFRRLANQELTYFRKKMEAEKNLSFWIVTIHSLRTTLVSQILYVLRMQKHIITDLGSSTSIKETVYKLDAVRRRHKKTILSKKCTASNLFNGNPPSWRHHLLLRLWRIGPLSVGLVPSFQNLCRSCAQKLVSFSPTLILSHVLPFV